LGTQASVDLQTESAKVVLYTPPPGKIALIFGVLLTNISASCAAGDDYNFGTGAAADDGFDAVDLSGITTGFATDYMYVTGVNNTKYTLVDGDAAALADRQFGVYVVSGTTAATTCTARVLGILIDS